MLWALRKPVDDSAMALVSRLVREQGVKYWKRYVVAFVLMGLSAGATALSAYLLGQVINKAYVDRDVDAIAWLCLVTIVLFTAKGAATYGQAVILNRIANAILADNQRRLFAKLMNESIGFFSARHSSEFLARMSAGAGAVAQVLNSIVNAAGRDLLALIGLVAVMVTQDPVMSLFGLAIAPPALFTIRKLVRRIKGLAHTQFVGSATTLETMQEALQGIRTVKAFSLEDIMRKRMDDSVATVEAIANKMARISHRSSPLMETLGGFAIAGALMYGGYRVVVTNAMPGQFFSFLTAFLLAYEPAKRLARLNIELNSNLIGARMLLDVVDSPSSEPADDHKPALRLSEARVEFRNVTFGYRPGEPVLRDMSFVAPAGQTTALVGPSGGGKSTILALLLRFYDAHDGTVLVDGQDIGEVSRASLRAAIGYVGQDVYLFRGSVRENIAFGRPGASEEEIAAAAKAAFAHDFIMSFPDGYDSQVGEHGGHLSGGQRQRIAVARALLKDAPLVLLDEATAALDSESEMLVQEAIARLCEGRTTIVIAHRLHTIMHAQSILVIEEGRVVEQGRHDELLRRDGRYATFFRLQHREATLAPLEIVH
jgi:ATP-binding cassette subfamily B protein